MCSAPIEWQWNIFNDFPHGPTRISPTKILQHYCPMSFGLHRTQSSSASGNVFSRNEWKEKHFLGILGTQLTQFGMLLILHSIWTSKFKLLSCTYINFCNNPNFLSSSPTQGKHFPKYSDLFFQLPEQNLLNFHVYLLVKCIWPLTLSRVLWDTYL